MRIAREDTGAGGVCFDGGGGGGARAILCSWPTCRTATSSAASCSTRLAPPPPPTSLRPSPAFARPPAMPAPLGEQELVEAVGALAARNRPLSGWDSFLGAGVYHRFSPAIVRATISRPEVLHGVHAVPGRGRAGHAPGHLRVPDHRQRAHGSGRQRVADDGASAAAEAVLMARRLTGRERVVIRRACTPTTPAPSRPTSRLGTGSASLAACPSATTAPPTSPRSRRRSPANTRVLVVGYPNFFGLRGRPPARSPRRPTRRGRSSSRRRSEPFALAVLEPPGALGRRHRGGRGAAARACRRSSAAPAWASSRAGRCRYLQQVPGRLVGQTVDHEGAAAYAPHPATREQHIRREGPPATSAPTRADGAGRHRLHGADGRRRNEPHRRGQRAPGARARRAADRAARLRARLPNPALPLGVRAALPDVSARAGGGSASERNHRRPPAGGGRGRGDATSCWSAAPSSPHPTPSSVLWLQLESRRGCPPVDAHERAHRRRRRRAGAQRRRGAELRRRRGAGLRGPDGDRTTGHRGRQ